MNNDTLRPGLKKAVTCTNNYTPKKGTFSASCEDPKDPLYNGLPALDVYQISCIQSPIFVHARSRIAAIKLVLDFTVIGEVKHTDEADINSEEVERTLAGLFAEF